MSSSPFDYTNDKCLTNQLFIYLPTYTLRKTSCKRTKIGVPFDSMDFKSVTSLDDQRTFFCYLKGHLILPPGGLVGVAPFPRSRRMCGCSLTETVRPLLYKTQLF